MKESEIRPDQFQNELKKLWKVDASRMLSKSDSFASVPCPACGSKSFNLFFEKHDLKYNQCDKCGTIFISPRPTVEILDFFYKGSPNYKFWNEYIFPATKDIRRKKLFRPRAEKIVEIINNYIPTADSLIEIGAGHGFFVEEIIKLKKFNHILAVEPTKGLADTLREKDIEVIEDLIENMDKKYNSNFDILVNFEVIEHLYSPKDFLLRSKELLKEKGIIFITCPNGKGFDNATLGKESITFDYEHLNYFNPKSIEILLNDCGFEVLIVETPGKLDVDLVKKALDEERIDLADNIFLKTLFNEGNPLKLNRFQKYLSENGLSGHLQVVARKL